ncbi:MAG: hypothetical protein ACK5VH_05620 [bacterium]|jgi:hypothetical protein|nr:hypothetical protein [Chitinophagaceae bacterium]
MIVQLDTGQSYLLKEGFYPSLELVFTLPEVPTHFRTFKYTWTTAGLPFVSSILSPKIMKFRDGSCLMASRCIGTWVYDPMHPRQLRWIIYGGAVQPFFRYDDQSMRHWLETGGACPKEMLIRLIHTNKPIELSISRLSFKPVLIFTDHCDFDSDILLRKQRTCFSSRGIRVTKRVFLKKHTHKGEWNSAWEGNEDEFHRWASEGHELCYHALSQSKLPDPAVQEALVEQFQSPLDDPTQFRTWIDHGYQRYNVSKALDLKDRSRRLWHLSQKGVRQCWNYYDVAEVTDNLNQLDYDQMAPFRILTARHLTLTEKIRILLFFNSTEQDLIRYRAIAGIIKDRKIFQLLQQGLIFVILVLKALFPRKLERRLRNAQSIIPTEVPQMTAFQSLIVKDFSKAFGEPYVRFKKESGLAIVHTYFSFLEGHHGSTLFKSKSGDMEPRVEQVFSMIGQDIAHGNLFQNKYKTFKYPF